MIVLTNLHGERLAINDELIERVEGDHETRVVLTSGTHYIVTEPLDEVVRRCRQHRAEILALSRQIHLPPPSPGPEDADGAELHLLREDSRGSLKSGR
ncbi:MAG: flagellar FlbD family protein [Acidimicrobiales bacterium]|jgi:flagellar protein FlbD